jgi:DNA (cytosine-5)-methyltransferase 1
VSFLALPQRTILRELIEDSPGESLPPYPNPTHTPETAVTVNQVLCNIPDGFPNHDGAIARDFPAWDGDAPLKYTITCSGGVGNYHPSGKRDFTLREFACLQGFPLEHKFAGNAVKRQIGNAVPPCAAKAFYDEIIRHMKKMDGVQ